MTTNIDDAVNAAMAAAKNLPATQTPASAPAVAVSPGKPRTFQDAVADSAMAVDHYIKVDEYGLHIGDDKTIFETISVEIDLSEVQWPLGIRYMAGGRANYAKSMDGVRDTRGKPWAEVVAVATQMDAGCRGQYSMADIPMVLNKPIKLKDQVLEAGTRIGYSTSITGYKPFLSWFKQQLDANGGDINSTVELNLGFIVKKKNGNEWGEITYNTVQ